MDIPPGLHGAHLRRELIKLVGRHRTDAAVSRGELRRLWVGTLVEARRYTDLWTRSAAALLLYGHHAAISGPTAARLHGITAIETAEVHVLVGYGHPLRSREGLAMHNGPHLRQDHVVELAGLRVLPLERVVVDLLCTARPGDALAVADQALAARRMEFRQLLRDCLDSRPDRRGTLRAERLLGLASERAESPAESWLRLMVVELGFPSPQVNWSVRSETTGAELFRIDLAWPVERIALEYNGYAVHAGREGEDERRTAELRRRGWIVIVVTKDDLRDSSRLESLLRQAFHSRRCYTAPGSLAGYRKKTP